MKLVIHSAPTHGTPVHVSLATQLLCLAAGFALWAAPAHGAELAQTIERIKPTVFGVGIFLKTRRSSIQFDGTGFVVADGRHVITNAYAVASPLDAEKKRKLASCSFPGSANPCRR